MKRTGLLLVGHGNRIEDNQQEITITANIMQEMKPDYIVKPCFLEFSTPTVVDGINAMKREDIDILVVVPLFLTKGIHVIRDIPHLLNLEPGKKQGSLHLDNGRDIPLLYANPIGADSLLAELLLKNAQVAIDCAHL